MQWKTENKKTNSQPDEHFLSFFRSPEFFFLNFLLMVSLQYHTIGLCRRIIKPKSVNFDISKRHTRFVYQRLFLTQLLHFLIQIYINFFQFLK